MLARRCLGAHLRNIDKGKDRVIRYELRVASVITSVTLPVEYYRRHSKMKNKVRIEYRHVIPGNKGQITLQGNKVT